MIQFGEPISCNYSFTVLAHITIRGILFTDGLHDIHKIFIQQIKVSYASCLYTHLVLHKSFTLAVVVILSRTFSRKSCLLELFFLKLSNFSYGRIHVSGTW